MSSEGLHEPAELLTDDVLDRHRAINSLREELEAVDWYDQRIHGTNDASLAAVLAHNRDEEKEHAAMVIEWLRRHDPELDRHLRTYLFTTAPITEIEDAAEHGGDGPAAATGTGDTPRPGSEGDGSLGIGSRRAPREGWIVNHLLRELAPITDAAWAEIETEARRSLVTFLAGRQLVDFSGPKGWDHPGESTGRTDAGAVPLAPGVETARREVRPMLELRVPFTLQRAELEAIERGASDTDLQPVIDAARALASAEDRAVFEGYEPGGVRGVAAASPHPPIGIGEDYEEYPGLVAKGVNLLRTAGVDGPYALALGPRCYVGVIEGTERGGYPVLQHLHLIVGGPVVWAPAVDGAVVMSQRGGDFELTVGQDVSIGFTGSTADEVHCYLEETITFGNHSPEATIALRYL